MGKPDWMLLAFMALMVLFFGMLGWGLHNEQKLQHECRMKMVEQSRPAADIKEVCRI
jgi:hypothetical protein